MKQALASLSKLRQKLPPRCPARMVTAESAELSDGSLADQSLLLRAALARAIKRSSKKRWVIAGEISALIGRELTTAMLDKYCAESAAAHRMPADTLAAFCLVTGDYGPLEIIVQPCGRLVLSRLPRLPADGEPCETLMRDLAAIVAESGQVAQVVGAVLADHKIDAAERDTLLREFLDVADRAIESCAHLHRGGLS